MGNCNVCVPVDEGKAKRNNIFLREEKEVRHLEKPVEFNKNVGSARNRRKEFMF